MEVNIIYKPNIIPFEQKSTIVIPKEPIIRRKLIYDFEVYQHANFWCVTFLDYDTDEITYIETDADLFRGFYENHKDDIFVGYNSREYDYWIFQALLLKRNVYQVNDELINQRKRGWQIFNRTKQYPIINYDVMIKDKSLKQIEAFMGSEIKETSIPFDFKGVLTKEQRLEIKKYNIHDVRETKKVLTETKSDFDSLLGLIEMYNLDITLANQTPAQITGQITGAVKQHTQDDEFDISIPETLRLPNEWQFLIDYYNNPRNKSYKKALKSTSNGDARTLKFDVFGVPTVMGYGGIHGALDNYYGEGLYISYDVASLYPSLMIVYNYLSRKLKDPSVYEGIKKLRLELKHKKDPKQASLKLVLNAFYGILKAITNTAFDPLMSNNVCIAGQLLLMDSVIKISHLLDDKTYLTNINTDGVFLKIENIEKYNQMKDILQEWQERTGLELEYEEFRKVFQKDVNNYIIIPEGDLYYPSGEPRFKTKGAYVKQLSKIDNDLPILNKALVKYFTEDIPIRQTVESATHLIDFQKIVKRTSKFEKTYLLSEDIKTKSDLKEVDFILDIEEKVNRVFATIEEDAPKIYNWKNGKPFAIANTPDKCRIVNEDITETLVPDWLDIEYYVQMGEKRLEDFFKVEEVKVDEVRETLFEAFEETNNLYDFMAYLVDRKKLNKSTIKYFEADCLNVYGNVQKIIKYSEYFKLLYNKKSISVANLDKKIEDDNIKHMILTNSKLTPSGKSVKDIDFETILKLIWDYIPNESNHPIDIMKTQIELFDNITYIDTTLDDDYYFILNWYNNISPFIITYNVRTGEIENYYVNKKAFNITPIFDGDIIRIENQTVDYHTKIVGKDVKGVNQFEKDMNKPFKRIESFDILARDYKKAKTQEELNEDKD